MCKLQILERLILCKMGIKYNDRADPKDIDIPIDYIDEIFTLNFH